MTREIHTAIQKRAYQSQQRGTIGEKAVELMFDRAGWASQKLGRDDGEDIFVEVRDDFGSSGLKFQVQVKTPEKIQRVKSGNSRGAARYEIETKHLKRWENMIPPVFILLWDVENDRGNWVAVSKVIEEMNSQDANWMHKKKIRVHFPVCNSTDEAGLKRLRRQAADSIFPSVARGRDIEFELEFQVPDEQESQEDFEQFFRFFSSGKSAYLKGKYLQKVAHSSWYERLYGPEINQIADKDQVVFFLETYSTSQAFELLVTVLNDAGRRIGNQLLIAKAETVGEEGIRVTNRVQPIPFFFEMVVDSAKKINLSWSGTHAISKVKDLKTAFKFLDALRQGNRLRLQFAFPGGGQSEVGPVEIPLSLERKAEPSPEYRQFILDLAKIEEELGIEFDLKDARISQRHALLVKGILSILQTGEWRHDIDTIEVAAHDRKVVEEQNSPDGDEFKHLFELPALVDWIIPILKRAEDGGLVELELEGSTELTLFGARIPMGAHKTMLKGQLSTETIRELREKIDDGGPVESITLKMERGFAHEKYRDWVSPQPAAG